MSPEKRTKRTSVNAVSDDSSDRGAITPNRLLLGNKATAIASVVGVDDFDHRKRYACAQSYANAIWSRWIKEYGPALNRRYEWYTPAEQHLKTGDIVRVVEETNPRGYYPTARITELRDGSDSVARSAVLRTSSGLLVRKFGTHCPNILFWPGGCYQVNKSRREIISQSELSISKYLNKNIICSNIRGKFQ